MTDDSPNFKVNVLDNKNKRIHGIYVRTTVIVALYAFSILLAVIYKQAEDKIVYLKEKKEEYEARKQKLENMIQRYSYTRKMEAMTMEGSEYKDKLDGEINNEENTELRKTWKTILEEV